MGSLKQDSLAPPATGAGSAGKSIPRKTFSGIAGVLLILAGAQAAFAQADSQLQRNYEQQNRAIERQLQDNSQQQLQQQQLNQIRGQQMRQQLTPPPYVPPPPPVQNFRR
ncbi:hypothetical protein C7450_109248 [Chelatococcus asaccharovorans]|uniref:Uncharacterized protein n=1 Tax=Chelatococcus asaccharovorans TaxID=28210 RepID=A0A2V3U2N2_9HYPH|nr:hypothetical protein C7450_109248 [Chelatococcus asaccharovorans]